MSDQSGGAPPRNRLTTVEIAEQARLLRERTNELAARQDAQGDAINSISHRVADHDDRFAGVDTALADLLATSQSSADRLDDHDRLFNAQATHNDDVDGRIAQMVQINQAHRGRLDDHAGRLDDVDGRIRGLVTINDGFNTRLVETDARVTRLERMLHVDPMLYAIAGVAGLIGMVLGYLLGSAVVGNKPATQGMTDATAHNVVANWAHQLHIAHFVASFGLGLVFFGFALFIISLISPSDGNEQEDDDAAAAADPPAAGTNRRGWRRRNRPAPAAPANAQGNNPPAPAPQAAPTTQNPVVP